ncbi:RNA pyrophosphohydrolase [Alkalicaulis satelles]|uniref:RNA pyrophosphohydrolase n=1 Tax=Alkalicaulis satelles TaxID=2609175 RepID=A0A5M6ZJ91_9PROT|nr:RNA pyrophosphohydrolase [Alkalicaulis satelles]KAA5803814.1 RNA pyrophosphohydrolase [Alkalicaulis satelles]
MSQDPYPEHRPNAGIVLFDRRGLVWLGKRYAHHGPWAWQFPQGGLDAGEDPETGALRELYEETGVTDDLVEKIGEIPGWLAYDFPPDILAQRRRNNWKGQKQRWFAYRFHGTDVAFDLKAVPPQEFETFRWAHLAEAPPLMIPWKRPVYEIVAKGFAHLAAR